MRHFAVILLSLAPCVAQVTSDRLVNAAAEPRNWLTYSGTYMSQRYSTLDQITPGNVAKLEQKWVFQAESLQKFETTPLVLDGVMYLTQPPNDVVALDARTGRIFWIYQHRPAPNSKPCCGAVNRGLAILGDTLFLATLDARLVALDARNGKPLWTFTTVRHDRLKSAPAKVTRHGSQYEIWGAAWGAPIAAVEVRIDDGPWMPATLLGRLPGGKKQTGFAWRFWEITWGTPLAGEHRITSRAFDVDGNIQPAPEDPFLASKVTFWEANGQITRRVLIPS